MTLPKTTLHALALSACAMLVLSLAAGSPVAAAEPPRAALTKDNFVEVGDDLVDLLDTSGLAFATFVLGQAATPAARPASLPPPVGLPRSEPFEAPCPGGGSVAGRIADRDADRELSTGDRFVTVFSACRVDPDSEAVNGSSEFVVQSHRIEGSVEVTELRFRFHGLGTDSLHWTGPASVVLRSDLRNGSEHYIVDYHDLAVRHGTRACRWNYRLDVRRAPLGEQSARVDGAVTIGRLALTLVQDEPFVPGRGGAPRTGRLTATDADGNRLQLDAAPHRYRYRYFARGNRTDTPDASSQSRRGDER